MNVSAQTKVGVLWGNPAARPVILKYIPEIEAQPHLSFLYKNLKLSDYPGYTQAVEEEAWLMGILSELASVPDGVPVWSNDGHAAPPPSYELGSVIAASASATSSGQIGLWDVWEVELRGPGHGNPYVDVELGAQFCIGSRKIHMPGFYDGDGVYRIRFMPDTKGEWRFSTCSNARSLDGIEGRFVCVGATEGNHGPVRVKNRFHFGYEDGTPYVPVGTTSYAWTHQGQELEEQTLQSLARSPFNKIRMCVFPKSYLYNVNEPALEAFQRTSDGAWDFERFNPDFFRHLETRVADLGKLGIEADLILFHPYDRWGYAEMDRATDDRYLRYIVARLAAYRNVWWSLANEYDLMWAKTEDDWERFARMVKENDPFGHLISNHNCMAFYDFSKPWVTHCSLQRVDVYKTAESTNEWRERWGKPVVIDECAYEGDIDQGWGNITGEEMARRFWEGAIRGGYVGHGETYLNPEQTLWWSKGGELRGTSPERIGFLRKIMEEGPAEGLNPLPSDWDVPRAGVDGLYYLYYFGFNQPKFREFRHRPGIQYWVDIIDTWNMTVCRLDRAYEGTFRIELPGRPYMAVRMTRKEE